MRYIFPSQSQTNPQLYQEEIFVIRKIFNIIVALHRDVNCPYCKSRNITLRNFSVVDPHLIEEALYIARGLSLAARFGMESARGNYKKTACGNIFQTRDETYECHKCGRTFEIRRERVIASTP